MAGVQIGSSDVLHPHAAAVVRVAVPLALDKSLDYQWISPTPPLCGAWVSVPVGKQRCVGVVVGVDPSDALTGKLKTAEAIPNVPTLTPQTLKFYTWATRYTMANPGDSVRAGLVSGAIPSMPLVPQKLVAAQNIPELKLTTKQQQVMAVAAGRGWGKSELAAAAGVSSAVVDGLITKKWLQWVDYLPSPATLPPTQVAPVLSPAQQTAVEKINLALTQHLHRVFLLDGITGSGKTEVYFDAIQHALQQEKTAQILLLVPEIALTPQLIERFEHRFGVRAAVWHSHASATQKAAVWWGIAQGFARVVIGARSSLFLPFQNLKLVVVDEEHDGSYKQDDVFRYHGRDMAVTLGHVWSAPVILGSATPSLESWHNAYAGKYELLTLPSRAGGAQLPTLHMVDLRTDKPARGCFISGALTAAIGTALGRKEQALVFLNRRGVAPLLLCGGCGHRVDCPHCSASLTVHGDRLACHHCGFSEHTPEVCPKCGEDALNAYGPGTRRLVQEVQDLFPHARVAVADSDAIQTPAHMMELITNVRTHAVDVVVGTQMVTKGHHFPSLTVVGVIDGDMGLALGDVRASEKTFALLTQVAGRAGRAEKAGVVYIQTHQPEHPLFAAFLKGDRNGFYETELAARKVWADPPYGRLTAVIVRGVHEQHVQQAAHTLAQAFPAAGGYTLLGPAPAVLLKRRNEYRWRLLVKSVQPAQKHVALWLAGVKLPTTVRVDVDVDPVRFE